MKYEITEEQIKEIAKGNAKVKKWFPEAFENKLELGKWYKGTYLDSNNDLLFISNLDEKRNLKGFGVSYAGNWFDCRKETLHYGNIEESKDWTPATDSEVEEALTNEAKKRGFKEGVCFTTPFSDSGTGNTFESFLDFNINHNSLWVYSTEKLANRRIIFKDGIWSEIVKTYTKEEA